MQNNILNYKNKSLKRL